MVVSSPPSITLNMMRAARPRSLPQLHLGVLPHLLQEFQVLPHAEQVITRDPVPVGTFLNFLLNLEILLLAYRVESYAVAYVRELDQLFMEGNGNLNQAGGEDRLFGRGDFLLLYIFECGHQLVKRYYEVVVED